MQDAILDERALLHLATTSTDDRLLAALAHGSAFFLFFGPLIPLVL